MMVTAIERRLRRADPTICLLEPPPGIPWGYHQFLSALKRTCGLVGLHPKSIGAHSLRRTGAQLLERLKIGAQIKVYTNTPNYPVKRLAYGKAIASLLEG